MNEYVLQRAFCAFCHDRIWGLGRQGFKCIQCKLLVHKKCHKLVQMPCTNEHVEPIIKDEHNGGDMSATSTSLSGVGTPTTELLPDVKEFPEPPPPPDVTGDSVPVEDPSKPGDDALEAGTQRQYSLNDFELIRVIGTCIYHSIFLW